MTSQDKNTQPDKDKAEALAEALRDMLYIFDRNLPDGSIGRNTCDKAREALAEYGK